MNTKYMRFNPGQQSAFDKELYGYILASSEGRTFDYTGIVFHVDGTSFHCQIDNEDISDTKEHEVSCLEFISNFPVSNLPKSIQR